MYFVYSTWCNRNSETRKQFETLQSCYEHIERSARKETFCAARVQDDEYKINELWVATMDGSGTVKLDGFKATTTLEEAAKDAMHHVFGDMILDTVIWCCENYGIETKTKKGRIKARGELESKLIKAMIRRRTGIIVQDF